MIEFISLCVCSACLSCICCLITGGLCVTRAGGRLRNKIVENHLPDDMQWLGNLPRSEYLSESDGSNSSDVYPVPYRICPKDKRSNCYCKIPKEVSNEDSEILDVGKTKSAKSKSSGKKETGIKSGDKSRKPRRWRFCLRSGKSSECSCVPIEKKEKEEKEKEEEEEETEDADPAERTEPKCCCYKKRKKLRRSGKNGSKTRCAYFKPCSCTNLEESRKKRSLKKYKSSETPATRYQADYRTDKRASKKSRKSIKCPKNCQCKIIAENKTTDHKSERKMENRCKCRVKN